MDTVGCSIFKEKFEVNNRLEEIGLNQDILREVAEAAHLAFVSSSDNDPPFIPGTDAWSRAVRHLRNRLLMIGWRKDDPGNYSITISDDHKINIIVASGDNCTGTKQTPKTKSVKGIKTELAIQCNQYQDDMFKELLPEEARLAEKTLGYQTWVFLFHVTEDSISSELSLPFYIDKGHIAAWRERILLPEITCDPSGGEDQHEDEEIIDVQVTRKQPG